MKKLLFFALVIVATACSKHGDPSPKYSDISGHWHGQSTTLMVDLVITKANTTFTVSSGALKIGVNSYAITIPETIDTDIKQLFAHGDQGWIQINAYVVSSDFKTISASNEIYYDGANVTQINEPLTITRK